MNTLRTWYHRYWYCSRVRAFYQRGMRGYADTDVWNFDNYLAGVIAGGLRQLCDHGCPIHDHTNDDDMFRCYKERKKRWIETLEAYAADVPAMHANPTVEVMHEIAEEFPTLWD